MKTSLSKKLIIASAALLASAALALPSYAQVLPGYTTAGTETNLAGYGLSGFEFTPTSNIDITALGFTAISLGGGDAPHVTLWNATAGVSSLVQMYDTGNILGSVNSTGAADPASPSFVSVGTPILLTAGNTYLVTAPAYWAATFDSTSGGTIPDPALGTTSFLKASGGWSGWDNAGYNFSSLSAASATQTPTVANLKFSVVEVPEPSTYALLGAGLLTLVVTLRRKAARATL